jgi:hypothetical protein
MHVLGICLLICMHALSECVLSGNPLQSIYTVELF